MADRAGAVRVAVFRAARPTRLTVCSAALLCLLVAAAPAAARTLEEALVSTFPGALRADGEGLATVFRRTVPASFPVTGASSSYAYRFDPATDSFQRLSIPLGPVFSERAETLGARKLSVGINYLLVRYDTIDDRDLDNLVSNDPTKAGDHVAICTGPPNKPGVVCEPVAAAARVDLEAQMVTLSATYGVTPELDVNVFLPVVRTFVRSSTSFLGPDPRAPQMSGYFPFYYAARTSETATGLGDLLLRAKYLLARSAPVHLAAGLTLSLPTGNPANFQGTGDTLLGTALYASQTYAERVEPHVNLGFVLDTRTLDRSQVRYSAGADVRVFDWLTVNNDFLGSSDVAQPGAIPHPVFVQLDRADVFQWSTGLKVAPWRRLVGFFNALLPLNRDGLRADVVLTFGIEWVF